MDKYLGILIFVLCPLPDHWGPKSEEIRYRRVTWRTLRSGLQPRLCLWETPHADMPRALTGER